MKKLAVALLIVLCAATVAFAAYGKKGYIPEGDPVSYRGLKVTEDGVNIVLRNKSDRPVVFNAALAFLDKRRREVGDIYIEKTTIEANGEVALKNLYLKGDVKACRTAETLRWTIYLLEKK